MQNGNYTPKMGDTGFQPQIGLLPQWDALYLTSGDSRAWKSVQANAKALNSYPIVWNDPTTHLPVRPSDRPTWNSCGDQCGGSTSVGAGPFTWDIAHHGSGGYLAYIVTGDYFYLETLEDQAAMCYLLDNGGSTGGTGTSRSFKAIVQTRGVAWCFRTVSQFAAVAPASDTIASDYRTWLAHGTTEFLGIVNTPGMNPLGYLFSYENYKAGTGTFGVGPWQEHFFVQSFGMGSDIEPLSNMANWAAVRDWVYRAPVGILGPNGASNYCFTDASAYSLQVSDTTSSDPTTWYTSWGTVWSKNHGGGTNTSCGNTLLGGSGGDPGVASTGYWGNLIPAIAYAKDHGAPGAAAAWTRLTGATNWSTVLNSGFADIPNWGIAPRSGNTPPPTTTVSVTSPASGATVSGTKNVTASASSSAGIAGVQFQLDGANVGAEITSTPYSLPWNTTAAVDGIHFLAAIARDAQGRLTASASVAVTVSNVPVPSPPIISAIVSVPTPSSALITWATDKPATSQVEYGTTTAYGSQTPADSTLLTAHSVTLIGLAASTTYQFRVHSTDAGGNAAVSVNLSFTTSVQSGGGIPPGTWLEVTNSHLPVYNGPLANAIHGNTGPVSIMDAWNGAALDTVNDRLIVFGGGHQDYYGNEVYAFSLSQRTWSQLSLPSDPGGTCNPSTNGCLGPTLPDGQPTAVHTYDTPNFIPALNAVFSMAGAINTGYRDYWLFDLTQNKWTRDIAPPAYAAASSSNVADYDPITQHIFIMPYGPIGGQQSNGLSEYDPIANTFTKHGSNDVSDYHMSAAVDPVHRYFVAVGGGFFQVFDLATGNLVRSNSTGDQTIVNGNAPGFVWDSVANKLVGWNGGSNVYLLDPTTWAWSVVSAGAGSATPTQPNSQGTFNRFQYSPLSNLFIVVNRTNEDVYLYKPNF
jgi:hypothetical protein